MKAILKKLRTQLDMVTNEIQYKFDQMTGLEYDKKIDFHEEVTSIQIQVEELRDAIDSLLDNS